MSHVYYCKTRWLLKVLSRLKRGKQGYKKETIPIAKDFRHATEARRFYVCNIFGFKYGILSHDINTVCQEIMYHSTTMGKVRILPLTYGVISKPRHFPGENE